MHFCLCKFAFSPVLLRTAEFLLEKASFLNKNEKTSQLFLKLTILFQI